MFMIVARDEAAAAGRSILQPEYWATGAKLCIVVQGGVAFEHWDHQMQHAIHQHARAGGFTGIIFRGSPAWYRRSASPRREPTIRQLGMMYELEP